MLSLISPYNLNSGIDAWKMTLLDLLPKDEDDLLNINTPLSEKGVGTKPSTIDIAPLKITNSHYGNNGLYWYLKVGSMKTCHDGLRLTYYFDKRCSHDFITSWTDGSGQHNDAWTRSIRWCPCESLCPICDGKYSMGDSCQDTDAKRWCPCESPCPICDGKYSMDDSCQDTDAIRWCPCESPCPICDSKYSTDDSCQDTDASGWWPCESPCPICDSKYSTDSSGQDTDASTNGIRWWPCESPQTICDGKYSTDVKGQDADASTTGVRWCPLTDATGQDRDDST